MADLRKAAEMAIEALMGLDSYKRAEAIIELRKALHESKWAGLTDDEIYEAIELLEMEDRWNHIAYHLAKTIEIKLRNKNT